MPVALNSGVRLLGAARYWVPRTVGAGNYFLDFTYLPSYKIARVYTLMYASYEQPGRGASVERTVLGLGFLREKVLLGRSLLASQEGFRNVWGEV
jgi:hypothetical protein